MTASEKEIVDRVANLVSKFFYIQGYSGEGDYIPHAIASALKRGYIICNKCNGSGAYHGVENVCINCSGTGKIEFKI